jgi:outer membrane lipoprotein LolB
MPPVALVLAALWLAACATTPSPRTLLASESQEALLLALPGFSIEGRAGVKAGAEPKGFQASLDWRQVGDESRAELAGPFGAGRLAVTWRPGMLRLEGGRGEQYENADAEAVLMRELGFIPPFEALRFWMLGLQAPGEEPTQLTPAAGEGRLGDLTQQGWHIRYEQWMNVAAAGGDVQLPRRLTATRDDLRLRVVVDKWKL